MALNIKSDQAHRLAKELAEARGQSLTDAVTDALRQTLETERVGGPDPLLAEVEEIQRLVASLPDRDRRPAEDILGYDADGLPS